MPCCLKAILGRKRLTWETKGYHLPVLIALVVLLTATGSLWQQSAKGATLIDGGYQPPNPRRYGGQSPPALTGASLLRLGSRGGVEAFVYHTLGESSSWASTLSASIYVDGEELSLTDPAVLIEGRVLVPIRGLMEALQAVVEWEPNLRTVSITRDKVSTLKLWTDNRLFFYRDAATTYYGVCDVAPRIINDKTYLPLRMVAEALGISIEWDEMGRRIIIDTAKALATKPDHDLSILGVNSGQRITDSMNLKLSFEPGGQPEGETPTRYFLLDPATGTGKLIAMSASVNEAVSWLPDLTLNGKTGILAAIILDKQGLFLRGTAVEVHLEVTPRVALQGITPNQQMTGETTMSVQTNFHTRGVEYEFTEISSGSSTRSILTDPSGIYTHVPPAGQTGLIAVRAIAFDAAGNPITSEQIILQAQVPEEDSTPYVKLHNFAIADVGKVPVTLSISRNFDAHSTQYWARSVNSSVEVLLAEMPWGDYQWFPGPDTAGEWDILVKVIAPDGKIHTSNPIRVTVPATPGILLRGAGPGQVITGELRLSSLANVPLTRVEYRLQNLGDGSYISVGLAESSAHEVVFTPRQAYEGERRLQAIGTMADGTTIIDEFTVRIYLGELFAARPVTSKEGFMSLITPLALQSQKQTGMSAALQVAQAILETGWGQSLPVDRYTGQFSYNLFGIKGRGSAGSVISSTLEEYYGTMYRIDDYFRAYSSVQESWADHKNLLLLADRYQPFRDVMFNSTSGAYALRRCGYATASNYPDALIAIIEEYDLDFLDWQPI